MQLTNRIKHILILLCIIVSIKSFNINKLLSKSIITISLFTQPIITIADNRLNAPTAAGTRVNSDAESLLRYGLPINNKEIREIQTNIENIKSDLKGRRVPYAQSDVSVAKRLLKEYKQKLLKAIPDNHKEKAVTVINKLEDDFIPLEQSLQSEVSTGSGSVQERDFLDQSLSNQDKLSKDLSTLEELFVPDSFARPIPQEFSNLPVLQGRAVVEMIIKRPDGSSYDVDGKLYDQVDLKMVIDGYNAPVTGGNFIDLVSKGFYNNKQITRSDGFVVQTGDADPNGEIHGYVPPNAKEERKVPLEISLKGDDELLYGVTSEDDGRGYAASVIPFQSYGALGMARSEYEANSASSQFFWLEFDSDLTPAGKNLLDGRYTCFGYTLDGAELIKDLKVGDIIVSAKVVQGLDKFIPAK